MSRTVPSSILKKNQPPPPFTNAKDLMLALLMGTLSPSKLWENPVFRIKFLLRSFLHCKTTYKLLDFLAHDPDLLKMLAVQPSLPCKLHRPYLSIAISEKERLNALFDHYKTIKKGLPHTLFSYTLSKKVHILSQLKGKNEQIVNIGLQSIDRFNKEGELSFVFLNDTKTMLAEITFVITNFQQHKTLFIGGLQGADVNVPHSAIQIATKECHGLFPKRLVMEAICCFAQQLGIEKIIAVSNNTHIYQNWRYYKRKKQALHADYDAFWLSLGAIQLDDGHYQLPLTIARKSMEEIQSKKRSAYQRRYQLLDQLSLDIKSYF